MIYNQIPPLHGVFFPPMCLFLYQNQRIFLNALHNTGDAIRVLLFTLFSRILSQLHNDVVANSISLVFGLCSFLEKETIIGNAGYRVQRERATRIEPHRDSVVPLRYSTHGLLQFLSGAGSAAGCRGRGSGSFQMAFQKFMRNALHGCTVWAVEQAPTGMDGRMGGRMGLLRCKSACKSAYVARSQIPVESAGEKANLSLFLVQCYCMACAISSPGLSTIF